MGRSKRFDEIMYIIVTTALSSYLSSLSLPAFANCLLSSKTTTTKRQTLEHAGDAYNPQETGRVFWGHERGRGENHICNDPRQLAMCIK